MTTRTSKRLSSKPAGPATHLLRYVRITVSLENAPFLNDEARKKHNPLSLTVNRALRLPGVRSDAKPLQKYVTPDPALVTAGRVQGRLLVSSSRPCPNDRQRRKTCLDRAATRALGQASASDAQGRDVFHNLEPYDSVADQEHR